MSTSTIGLTEEEREFFTLWEFEYLTARRNGRSHTTARNATREQLRRVFPNISNKITVGMAVKMGIRPAVYDPTAVTLANHLGHVCRKLKKTADGFSTTKPRRKAVKRKPKQHRLEAEQPAETGKPAEAFVPAELKAAQQVIDYILWVEPEIGDFLTFNFSFLSWQHQSMVSPLPELIFGEHGRLFDAGWRFLPINASFNEYTVMVKVAPAPSEDEQIIALRRLQDEFNRQVEERIQLMAANGGGLHALKSSIKYDSH